MLLATVAVAAWPASAQALPSFEQVRSNYQSSETLLLSREGEVLQRLRTDPQGRRGQWLALDEISPALRQALLLSEDKRFYQHSGVDWQAVAAAAWGNLWHQRTRGASTLTMQLAGLLDAQTQGRAGQRNALQKAGQALAAQALERQWRKDQILEAYLNLVPLRGELVGIDALSRTLFAKAAHGLDAREAALTAALVRAPNAKVALVAQRACALLQQMPGQGASGAAIDCFALEMFASAALQRRAFAAIEGIAPHFARQWLRQQSGRDAADQRSSLSAPLQRFAVQTLGQQLRELAGRNVQDGALLVLDNASGQVLAWVGSSGVLSQAGEVDGVLALRQPGSTLKPFLYAQALAQRRLTAASLIEDSAAQIATSAGLYIPQNYDRQFKGWVTLRQALAASLNVPAVRTLVMVTPDDFFAQLRALGLPLRESGGYFGYSLALGSSEVSLLHLTNAYRTLANGGRYSPVRWSAPASAPVWQPVLDPGAAFIVADILADAQARAATFGLDSVLSTRFWTAVKTGTSKDMRDNWAIGWSQQYTVGVWVGNASGAAMHDVSGSSGAAPVWAALMGFLHRQQPSQAPAPPPGVVQQALRFGAGSDGLPLAPARTEWFLRGTEQALVLPAEPAGRHANAAAAGSARIRTPTPGTVLALDPDIPPQQQRLWLEATVGAKNVRWRVAGRVLGAGARLAWAPWPGRHPIELLDARGQVLDRVQIEVRGAGLRR